MLSDARMKIIKTKRTKIEDAREVIAVNKREKLKDAREILASKQKMKPKPTAALNHPGIPHLKAARSLTLRSNDVDLDERVDFGPPVSALRRTVKNEMFLSNLPPSMPKPPQFMIKNDRAPRLSPELDPFDCYVVPTREHLPLPPMRLENPRFHPPGRQMSAHMDAYSTSKFPGRLLTSRNDDHDDRMDTDSYFKTSNVRSRLYSEPHRDRNESAGIFAKLPVRPTSPPAATIGHSIIISNLHKSVTQEDVVELFEDVGKLVSAKLIRPGTAEVIYKNLGDAEQAVDTYHNRQLDGQPMKCLLCHPSMKAYPKF